MAERITKVGRYRVVEDTDLDVDDLSLEQIAGFERRAARAVLQAARTVEPEILRCARRSLGLTQADLAMFMDVAPETISRWETGAEPFKRTVQLAMAAIVELFESNAAKEWKKKVAELGGDTYPGSGPVKLKAPARKAG
jgi:DNA-binding transcriptional regulator YiaG